MLTILQLNEQARFGNRSSMYPFMQNLSFISTWAQPSGIPSKAIVKRGEKHVQVW